MTWAKLGPLGYLQDIPSPRPTTTLSTQRAGDELVTRDGVRHIQRASRAPRSWDLEVPLRSAAQVAFLVACAQGAVIGPLYLHTEEAARTNMLPPHLAAPCSGTDVSLGPRSTSPVLVDGVPSVGVASAATAGVWSRTIPVRTSVALTLTARAASATSMATGTTVLEWRTVNLADATVVTGTVKTTAAGTSALATSTITPSATAVGLQVRVAAGVGRTVGALRLTEGAHAAPWVPGAGGAMVAVDDPQQTLVTLDPGFVRSNYFVTLREVG